MTRSLTRTEGELGASPDGDRATHEPSPAVSAVLVGIPSADFRRAHVFKIEIGANSLDDLVHELHHYAYELERGRVTNGCSGSPSAGSIYSYSHAPEWTKERYFAALDAHLEAQAIEALRAETGTGSVEDESAVVEDHAPEGSQP